MKKKDHTPTSLIEMAKGFQKSRILLTAIDLNVFGIIDMNSKSAPQIANETGTDANAMERLLNALAAMKLLNKKGIFFFNTPVAKRYLDQQSPDFLSGTKHKSNQWRNWNSLTEIVKMGQAKSSLKEIGDNNKTRSFIAAMHHRAIENGDEIISSLGVESVAHILDVGGGSGAYAMAFIRSGIAQKATIFDLPHVTSITREYVAEAGLNDKIDIKSGDYNLDPFGSDYDMVIMSAILHINSKDENKRLLRKGVKALKQGGILVIQEFLINESRTYPEHAALFSLNMLVSTQAGDIYTETEIHQWMSQGGLGEIFRVDYKSQHSILAGRKI